jgi:hypothetical protein
MAHAPVTQPLAPVTQPQAPKRPASRAPSSALRPRPASAPSQTRVAADGARPAAPLTAGYHVPLGVARAWPDTPADLERPRQPPRRRGRPGGGGLLAVTTRPAVRARLREVGAASALAPVRFAAAVEEALGPAGDADVLLLDLGSCCADQSLGPVVRAWERYHAGGELVVLTPLLDRERELRTAVTLVGELDLVRARVMTTSDFYRDEVWRNVGEGRERAALEAELRRGLLAAVRATGRPLRGEALVLELLHEAPERADVRAWAGAPLADVALGDAAADAAAESARKRRWRLLRRAGQLPAPWLLLVFRVLWLTKLRDEGWRSADVARFLGFASPRELRLTVKRRFGVGVRALRGVRHEDALRWAADLLTTSHLRLGELGRLTPRALVGPVVDAPPEPRREQPRSG